MRVEKIGLAEPRDALTAGIAAEHLVCADLLLRGWRAFMTDQSCPYDVALECRGRLVRVQVKATRAPKPTPQRRTLVKTYQWHVRRAGKGGRRVYARDEFDLLALVALDTGRIAYMPPSRHLQTIFIRADGDGERLGGKTGKTFQQFGIEGALAELGLGASAEISSIAERPLARARDRDADLFRDAVA